MNKKGIDYYELAGELINKYGKKERRSDDRNVLEKIILPYILTILKPKKVLDIGREDYEVFYNNFFTEQELWTIDMDPKCKEWGAKNHIVDNIVNIKKYFKNNYFDFVLMNGVFGWGLDEKNDIEKTFFDLYDIMKKDGLLVLGWNDWEDKEAIPLELSKIKSLKKFSKYFFEPLQANQYLCQGKGRHTYNFFVK